MEVTNTPPGPRIGNMLHALFEEVLDEPKLNTSEYLEKRSVELSMLSDKELAELGSEGKRKREEEEAKNLEEIRSKYHVR